MAQRTGGAVALAGEAWRLSRATHPEIQLYQADGHHPSVAGTYLTACVFYLTLFHHDIMGATPLTLRASEAKMLQQVAEKTISQSQK